jgi:hypothetical protein
MAKTVALQFFHLTQNTHYNWRIFMTRILSAVCITLFLALAFVSFHAYSSKANASTVAATPEPGARCPNIHKAVQALESAMNDMEKASNNYCGHKAEAMDATRVALDQLRRAENCQDCR